MKLEISEDTLLKEVLNSQVFGKNFEKRVEDIIYKKVEELLKKEYNRGFEDGVKSK
ncbi:MAG: hypothetical protein KKF67_02640 [Nanoarchaeota archaeon]|nr:hypothetical protein [Nanoarchaeota archaeon]